MSWAGWCDNPREHRREGERDFERGGRYGADQQKYNDHFDDCSKAYREGFDRARREEEWREERRQEEVAEERRVEGRRAERARAANEEELQLEQEFLCAEQERLEGRAAEEAADMAPTESQGGVL